MRPVYSNTHQYQSQWLMCSEWRRVLLPGGLLLVAVPDMRVLAKMYLDPSLSMQERFMVTKMIYGSQSDEFDYHHVCQLDMLRMLI